MGICCLVMENLNKTAPKNRFRFPHFMYFAASLPHIQGIDCIVYQCFSGVDKDVYRVCTHEFSASTHRKFELMVYQKNLHN